jgi:hypothetical protein
MEITYIRGLLFQGIMPHVTQNKLKKIKFYKGRLFLSFRWGSGEK